MKRARLYCLLLLICCATHGCAEYKRGLAEGQTDELVRQAADAGDKAVRFAKYGDAKFEDARKKFASDREEARRFAARSSELYEQAAALLDKAAEFSEAASRLDLAESVKEYYRIKTAQYSVNAELLRVRRGQVAAFSASESMGEASESAQAFEEKMDELWAKSRRLEERAAKLGAENNMVVPAK
ncbi:MAG TPA: hypothetical protein VGP08_07810 [Pyrinomonadaceae bacterium]|jgi:hypothetical protein|nr:hypothetical protein [Pyrinomonadaceae bacterium]